MMKPIFSITSICCALFIAAACEPETTGNDPALDYESLEVNFEATLQNQAWPTGSEVGLIATCTRNGEENVAMSTNPVARFKVSSSDGAAKLTPATDDDKVITLQGDHNWKFTAIWPYPEEGLTSGGIKVSVPTAQNYSAAGAVETLTYIGSTKAVSVIPTISLTLSTMFSIIEFNLPNDLKEGFETTLRTMTITMPSEAGGHLCESGTYNVSEGTLTQDPGSQSSVITVNFGEGLKLTDAYTKVQVVTSPFTIPETGLKINFLDSEGTDTEITALSSEREVGTVIGAGETFATYVSGTSDGIVPVTFPVIFPMGYPNGAQAATDGYNYPVESSTWVWTWYNDEACTPTSTRAGLWSGHHGTFYCQSQPQAYMKWVWADAINETSIKHFIETTNSFANKISTIGIKGVWTGDYFELVIPVRNFDANTTLQLKMPLYTRQGPTFWEVLYYDGDDWKSTAQDELPAYSGADVKARATWAIPYLAASSTTDNEQSVRMTFSNAVKSGELFIRVKCVDGSILSSGANAVTTGAVGPYNSNGTASAPFYFWNPGNRDNHPITIEKL